jgi:hypothetical protein
MEELREEARKLGLVMKTEDAVMLKFLADEMKVLSQVLIVGLGPAVVFAMEKFIAFANVLKANGTFWGSFSGKIKPMDLADAFFGPIAASGIFGKDVATIADKRAKDAIAKLTGAFTSSGAQSDSELTSLTEATEKQKKDLLAKQKGIENINAVPEFSDPEDKNKSPKLRDFTDNLTRAGNFLGSSQDIMQTIGREHTRLLSKIEQNTRIKTGVTRDTGNSDNIDDNFPD